MIHSADMFKPHPFILLILLFSCTFLSGMAQEKKRFWQRGLLHTADSMLTKRYFSSNIDTQYVVRPRTKWVLKTRYNFSGSSMYLRGVGKGGSFSSFLSSDFKHTLNISAGYLGLSVGLSVNPASWAGKYHDYEFNLNSYSNRWGIDFIYHSQQSAGGWLEFDDKKKQSIPQGALLSNILNLDSYFAFNHKRFSFPAAFSQSYIQRRSAGSWLLGFSFVGQWLEAGGKEDNQIPLNKLRSLNIAIGAGYGYNFVMRENWLLHISAVPTVVIWSHTETWNGREWKKVSSHFPDVIIAGRAALLRNFKRNFMGISFIANYNVIGEPSRLQLHTTKWRLRTFFGWRF